MGLLDWLFGKSGPNRGVQEWRHQLPEPQALGKLEGSGDFDFDIVGESKYQQNLLAIAGPKTEDGCEIEREATLHREPGNPHDANAIRVDIHGKTVGYIPRGDAAAIAPIMDKRGIAIVRVDALVIGGWSRKGSEGSFGVKLDMPFEQRR